MSIGTQSGPRIGVQKGPPLPAMVVQVANRRDPRAPRSALTSDGAARCRRCLFAHLGNPGWGPQRGWLIPAETSGRFDRLSLHQAGLADPGFPLDQYDLAAAVATAFPGPHQQPHLLLAPDKRGGTPGPGCGRPALDIPRRQDAPDRHRLGEPLQLIGPQIFEVEVIAEHRARGRTDNDLVWLRQCLQTRRQVRRLADDRGLRCRSFADLIADDDRPGGDADPHRELDPGMPRDRGIPLRHRIDQPAA